MKSELYQNFGGINSKASPYDTGVFEFLDISNMDFFIPGALRQRPGTGTFITGFSQLFNFSGATQLPTGPINGLYEFSNFNGNSFLIFSSNPQANISSGQTLSPMWVVKNQSLQSITLGITGVSIGVGYSAIVSFQTFGNAMFMADGNRFLKWDGNSGPVSQYSIPQPTMGLQAVGYSHAGFPAGPALTLTASYAYIDEFGFIGPACATFVTFYGATAPQINFYQTQLTFFYTPGGSTQTEYGFIVPNGYAIGASLTTYAGGYTNLFPGITGNPTAVGIFVDQGAGTQRQLLGFYGSVSGIIMAANDITLNNFYVPIGLSTGIFTASLNTPIEGFNYQSLLQNVYEPTTVNATLVPQFLEIFNNQLFSAGFSSVPSIVQFSDLGQPESVQPGNNFEVRTNDGDYLTMMRAYQNYLVFGKRNSLHVLTGTDPTNFDLIQVTDQYGCLNNKAVAVFNNTIVFLDKKGIAFYNGAQVQMLSDPKVQPLFDVMNYQAALKNSWMIHNKPKSQVWCGIPINGATLVNTIIVYDYLLNAFTHYDGLNINSANMAFNGSGVPNPYVGSYSGYPFYYGMSLTNDMGNGFSYTVKSKFIAEMGQSTEKMYRRLFINQESALGITMAWNVGLYADYQSTVSMTFAQNGTTFQTRSDFGLPAKAMAVQLWGFSSNDIVKLFGFTVESRYQRSV